MIQLQRTDPPAELTPDFVAEKTRQFATLGTTVWNYPWLRSALLDSSWKKCAYCECHLDVESKYMEVEHFRNKAQYPEHVLQWINLLPSCKRCNARKGSHDVEESPIVDPYMVSPSQHLYIENYRVESKDAIGQNTIDTLDLNDIEKAVFARFEVGSQLLGNIDLIVEYLQVFEQAPSQRRKNRVISMVKSNLLQCQPNSAYSASCATIIHRSSAYQSIVQRMKVLLMWDEELDALHEQSRTVVLNRD